MTAMSSLVEAVKRELAVPGTFGDIFPSTSDDDLIESLGDGFAEAQLNGFFSNVALVRSPGDDDWETSPDLSLAGTAVVVIFTSIRILRAQIRNLNTSERYKAGGVEMETQKAASVLKAEVDWLEKRLQAILDNAQRQTRRAASLATVFDNYIARGGDIWAAGGLASYEYKG